MSVKVVFYGEIAEATGTKMIELENQETVHSLYRYLEEQYPKLTHTPFKILVNNELINRERDLEEGDEILFLEAHVE